MNPYEFTHMTPKRAREFVKLASRRELERLLLGFYAEARRVLSDIPPMCKSCCNSSSGPSRKEGGR